MDRSRSPRHDPQWIARQVAILGRYPEKRPRDLKVTCDGHMYLDDLISAWGQQHHIEEGEVLTALRKYAARGEGANRFTMTCTVGGRTLIKVSPKLQPGSKPAGGYQYTIRTSTRAPAPKQSPKPDLDVKSKLDMSLDELMASSNGRTTYTGASSSSSQWKNGHYAVSKSRDDPIKKPHENGGDQIDQSQGAEPDGRSVRRTSLMDMTLDEATKVFEGDSSIAADKATSAAQDERSARVRRQMEQMGLTPASAHIRLPPGSKKKKKAMKDVGEVVIDSSPSPSPDRGEKQQAGDDADDIALAACAARALNVSGDVQISDAGGPSSAVDANGKSEPPPRPPGGNWEQYCDSEDSSLWYFWPGPGGQWWCGPNEGDEPHPYKDSGGE